MSYRIVIQYVNVIFGDKKMSEYKILVVDYDFFNYSSAIEYYLTSIGFQAKRYSVKIPLNFRTRVYNWLIKKANEIFNFKKAFRMLGWQIRKISKDILREYNDYKPDCVLFVKADYISREALLQMQESQLVVWMMDSYARYPYLIKDLGVYDNIFVFEKSDIKLLKKNNFNVYFLPLCADDRFFYPQSKERDIDILFIGAMYRERVKILQKMITRFPQAKIKIYGYYINRVEFIKKIVYKYTNKYKNFYGRVTPEEAGDLYSRSKICLNIHGSQSKYGANPRTFEILATKSFEIVDYNPYIEKILRDGVSFYRDENELFQKIEYYLTHDSERATIAAKGYEYTKEKHMFSQRIDELITECGWGKVL